ncbi:MAG TPA: Rieske 2Fe-2S domain-containing protein [Chloroflexota bacterium]|jgi:nitrite reductase/ring-hydroxylating ferredoxin subunit|nr:Rieske 2Fe-2S domain-containing protein [Chloroflexota bacterium]
MLSTQDNELVSRVGPGTPMGNLMRQYWLPAMLSSELPQPDSDPVRVLLLGEQLIAFRASNGAVGLIQNHCPHRGASLFFGRNEEAGLRCVYHGWKFDINGACLDMPNEPAESDFRTRVKAVAYPTQERGGVVWAYLGPRQTPPPLPDLEANNVAPGDGRVIAVQRECNWLQALEGDIDTSHLGFLHFGHAALDSAPVGTLQYYALKDRAPRYALVDQDYGTMYGAYRPAEPGTLYWRIALWLFPFYAMIPTGVLGHQVIARAWVPMDDEHTLFFNMSVNGRTVGGSPAAGAARWQFSGGEQLAPASDWYGRHRLVSRAENDYRIDRGVQRRLEDFTGIAGIHTQDQAVTESMGRIFDRSQEHLGSSDAMVIRVRRRLLDAARELAESGRVPFSAEHPEVYRQRSGGVVLPETADWVAATHDLRQAYVEHPELDPSMAGRG